MESSDKSMKWLINPSNLIYSCKTTKIICAINKLLYLASSLYISFPQFLDAEKLYNFSAEL